MHEIDDQLETNLVVTKRLVLAVCMNFEAKLLVDDQLSVCVISFLDWQLFINEKIPSFRMR